MQIKSIPISGFGRIGRAAFKWFAETPGFNAMAVNDTMPIENAAYLLQYDSF
jgi:glyceraldehyde-3-phosphate dehydrogenase/erythrose-4-phosphate dehydrogenase